VGLRTSAPARLMGGGRFRAELRAGRPAAPLLSRRPSPAQAAFGPGVFCGRTHLLPWPSPAYALHPPPATFGRVGQALGRATEQLTAVERQAAQPRRLVRLRL
jgi:hypothetical protein